MVHSSEEGETIGLSSWWTETDTDPLCVGLEGRAGLWTPLWFSIVMVHSCWSLVGSGPSVDFSGVVTGREGSRESGHTASLHMQQHSLKTEAQWSSSAAGYSQVTTGHTTRHNHTHTQPDTHTTRNTTPEEQATEYTFDPYILYCIMFRLRIKTLHRRQT